MVKRPIVILYALPDEAQYFSKEFERRSIEPIDRTTTGVQPGAEDVGDVVAYRIGVGLERARRNSAEVLDQLGPVHSAVIVGFAGGLANELHPGDIAIGAEVSGGSADAWLRADRYLFEAAEHVCVAGARSAQGRIVSTSNVVGTAAEKREAARIYGAIAVDMESAGAAAAIEERGGRWIAIRAVTDGVDDDLPFDFNHQSLQAKVDPYGGVDRGKIVACALRRPWTMPALVRLGFRSNRAARNLARFLHAFIPELSR